MDFEEPIDLPCVVCLTLFNQAKTIKSQQNLSLTLCGKLFRLYYSEIVAMSGVSQTQPVYDFSRECLPFCESCRGILINGIRLCEKVKTIQDELGKSMSKLRQKVLDSPQEEIDEELWPDHKLGLLRCQTLKSCKITADDTLSEFYLRNGSNGILDSKPEQGIADNGLMKVMVTRARVNEEVNVKLASTSTLVHYKASIEEIGHDYSKCIQVNPKSISKTFLDEDSGSGNTIHEKNIVTPKLISNEIEENYNSMDSDFANIHDSRKQESMNDSELGDESMLTTTSNGSKDHEYLSYSSEEEGKIILSEDVETVLEESETELELLSPIRAGPHTQQITQTRRRLINPGKPTYRVRRAVRSRTILQLKPNVCQQCGKAFRTNAGLNGHMWVHNKPYCGLCRQYFDTQMSMDEHKVAFHNNEEQYECRFCGKRYTSRETLLHHLRQHNDEETYSCANPDCASTFKTRQEVRAHIQVYHSTSTVTKPSPTFFIDSNLDDQDMFLPEDVEINDSQCSSNNILHNHEQDEVEERKGSDEFSFENYPHLTFTTEEDNSEESMIVSSGLTVSSPFKNGPQLQKLNTGSNKSFVSMYSRPLPTKTRGPNRLNNIRQRLTSSNQPPDGLFQCQQCGKRFSTKLQFRCHMRNHPTKVIECPVCLKRFNRLDNLKVHVKSHNNDVEQLNCRICNRKFGSAPLLQVHVRQHYAGPPPIKIEKNFEVRIHTCNICQKFFPNIDTLKVHFRTHNRLPKRRKNGSYPCEYCNKHFTYASNRRRHIVQFHMVQR